MRTYIVSPLCPFPLVDGIGSASQAVTMAQMLLTKGADVRTRCRWTDMNALHYASFFNVGPVINTLLEAAPGESQVKGYGVLNYAVMRMTYTL